MRFIPRPAGFTASYAGGKTNAMRSGVHPAIADMSLGHGDKKKSLQSLYLTISEQDLLDAIGRMKFNGEESENGGLFRRTT